MDDTHSAMIFERGAILPDEVGTSENGRLFWMGSQPFLHVRELDELTDESEIETHVILVRELFAKAITAMLAKMGEKGIRLILEISETSEFQNLSAAKTGDSFGIHTEGLTIIGDEDLLLTLLTNLIDNAIKVTFWRRLGNAFLVYYDTHEYM